VTLNGISLNDRSPNGISLTNGDHGGISLSGIGLGLKLPIMVHRFGNKPIGIILLTHMCAITFN
jgi:hypothetical protein